MQERSLVMSGDSTPDNSGSIAGYLRRAALVWIAFGVIYLVLHGVVWNARMSWWAVIPYSVAGVDLSLFIAALPYLWVLVSRPGTQRDPPATAFPATLFVIPTLIYDDRSVDRALATLEGHYLSQRESFLYFGLLTDFTDASTEHVSSDQAVLDRAIAGIARLDSKYPADGDHFFLAHRPRLWARGQGRWMARERKRGKLEDLNEFIVTGANHSFNAIAGAKEAIRAAVYAIVIDDDNTMEPGGAKRLVAHMKDPANTPIVDSRARVVVRGHGILVPLVREAAPRAQSTRYQNVISLSGSLMDSLEAYYHVAMDQGSFVGKGIYCIRTFYEVLHQRLPCDRVLSHDIIEGCYLRSGLVADVTVFESPPQTILHEIRRMQRWARGDWQVLSWSLPNVPAFSGLDEKNPLSALSRWKLVDNARRSLGPISIFLLIAAGWFAHLEAALLCGAAIGFRLFVASATSSLIVRRDRRHQYETWLFTLIREYLFFAVLPTLAFRSAQAIGISAWRMLVSRKNMLDWVASSVLSGAPPPRRSTALLSALVPNFAAVGVYTLLVATGAVVQSVAASMFSAIWITAALPVYWTCEE